MNTTPPAVLLDHYLKQLRLPTMLREYASVAAVGNNARLNAESKVPGFRFLRRWIRFSLRPSPRSIAPWSWN